ncbi:hypothetical protein V8C44DRAFT_326797, partial [Trichoderma aethiopicum]
MDQQPVDAAVLEAIKSFLSRPSTSQRAKDGLLRFLNADPSFSQVASILLMDEMEVRLERIEQVRKRAEEEQQNGEPFQFTILQLATLLVMPLDSLRDILQPTWPMPMPVYLTAGPFISLMTKGRPLLDGSSDASGASKGSSTKCIPRDETQRQKCLERDSRSCIFTKAAYPEVCHIIPFALNASVSSLEYLATCLPLASALLGRDACTWLHRQVGTAVGSSDKSWNMLSLSPTLHAWWEKALFGIKCLGVTHHDDKISEVKLQFHWMPSHSHKPRDCIRPPYQGFIQGLLESQAMGEPAHVEIIADARRDSLRELESGQTFEVLVDKDDAEKMKMALDVRWAVGRLQAISGAAGDWESEYYNLESGAAEAVSNTEQVEEWLQTVAPLTTDQEQAAI